MALKGDRKTIGYKDASYFMDEVAERGGVVCALTYSSGSALDGATHVVTYAANPTGLVPIGVLMWDMVDVDLTKYKLNQHRSETQKGTKVPILERGWVVTNFTENAITPGPAYVGHSGRIISTINNNIANSPLVGFVRSYADEDGYVKLEVNLP